MPTQDLPKSRLRLDRDPPEILLRVAWDLIESRPGPQGDLPEMLLGLILDPPWTCSRPTQDLPWTWLGPTQNSIKSELGLE